MIKQKQQLRKIGEEMKNNCITLRKFLKIYYGIYNESNDIKMSHKDIKELIPDIQRISFEDLLDNMRELYNGNIVAVIDSYGDIAPYVSPTLENTIEPRVYDCESVVEKLIIDENLSVNELSILCKKLKSCKKFKEYRIARKLLISKKPQSIKKYKSKKLELKMKGRNDYEY